MRIQHNIMAMNAYRNYTNNTSALSKNLEKLSSGYKINRAGDDAAGLAISEKMRAQITGLDVAQKNAKDGISLVQTAEGALTEVHDMLNRMVELAEQSANGTYDDVDRDQLQKEFDKLTEEIDRIADSSNFNGIQLLNGKLSGPSVEQTVGVAGADAPTITAATSMALKGTEGTASSEATIELDVAGMSITAPTDGSTGATVEFTIGGQKVSIDVTGDMDDEDIATALNGKSFVLDGQTFTAGTPATGTGGANTKVTFTAGTQAVTTTIAALTGQDATAAGVAGTPAGGTATPTTATLDFSNYTGSNLIGGTMTIGNTTYEFVETGKAPEGEGNKAIELDKDATAADIATAVQTALGADGTVTAAAGATAGTVTLTEQTASGKEIALSFENAGGLMLQIGDTGDSFNRIAVQVSSIKKDALKDLTEGTGKVLSELNIETANSAMDAMTSLKGMINYVSDIRGTLGATQNRLDHTINNLSVMEENIQDAESTIRDTDVAEEMMAYTKNNILVQSAQAMLAQANQVPQGVLQLLQ